MIVTNIAGDRSPSRLLLAASRPGALRWVFGKANLVGIALDGMRGRGDPGHGTSGALCSMDGGSCHSQLLIALLSFACFQCSSHAVRDDAGDDADVATNPCRIEAGAIGTCSEEMVFVPGSNCCIDRFEASIDDHGVASSRQGEVPAYTIVWEIADEACRAAGKHLCPVEVWEAACTAGGERVFPYGDVYDPEVCSGEARTSSPVPTGSMEGCEGGIEGLFDMSGNVFEWTDSCRPSNDGLSRCIVRGGGYAQYGEENFMCSVSVETPGFDGTGFRCCKPAEPTR